MQWLLACLCLTGSAWAQDHIIEQAYWTDPTAQAGFEQARVQPFTPYSGVLSKGYSSAAQWVRITIAAASHDEPLVLCVRPAYLDDLQLYDPLQPETLKKPLRAGDRVTRAGHADMSLNHTFVLPGSTHPRQVWLRLQTHSTQLLHIEVLRQNDTVRLEHRLWMWQALQLALLAAFLMWVLLAWLQDRDHVNRYFLIRQTVLLLYTASLFGYPRILLDGSLAPEALDLTHNWLVLLTTGLSFLFERKFLAEYPLPRWGQTLLNAVLFTSALAMALLLTGHTGAALHLNMLLNATGALSFLVVALALPRTSAALEKGTHYVLPKHVVVVYYLTIVTIFLITIIPALGLFSGTTLALYGVHFYGALSGVLITSILHFRSRQSQRLRQDMTHALWVSGQRVQLEQQRHEEQSQLLHMLMHELKTPLSVIELGVSRRVVTDKVSAPVNRAITNMKNILDRCLQADRVLEGKLKIHKLPMDVGALLESLVAEESLTQHRVILNVHRPLPKVISDMQVVQIIVQNLLDNACKYGEPQSGVVITLSQTSRDGMPGVCVAVANKVGLAGWPDANKVFSKYYRSTAAQRQSGTGLGLFLSASLARQLGGHCHYNPDDIWVRFELWLPC